jgi:hypothetical protein
MGAPLLDFGDLAVDHKHFRIKTVRLRVMWARDCCPPVFRRNPEAWRIDGHFLAGRHRFFESFLGLEVD